MGSVHMCVGALRVLHGFLARESLKSCVFICQCGVCENEKQIKNSSN